MRLRTHRRADLARFRSHCAILEEESDATFELPSSQGIRLLVRSASVGSLQTSVSRQARHRSSKWDAGAVREKAREHAGIRQSTLPASCEGFFLKPYHTKPRGPMYARLEQNRCNIRANPQGVRCLSKWLTVRSYIWTLRAQQHRSRAPCRTTAPCSMDWRAP